MPISSKRIIKHINSLSGSFTRDDLIKQISASKSKKTAQKGRHSQHKSRKDLNRIDETLGILTSAGFLSKQKKRYYRSGPFSFTGTIHINTSGHAMAVSDDGHEAIVKRDNVGHAHNNDRVTVEITDYKRGFFHGIVKKVLSRYKTIQIARVVKKTKGQIILLLVDHPGEKHVCAERSEHEPEPDDIVIVSLTGRLLGNLPHCEITNYFSLDDESYDFQRICAKHNLPSEHGYYPELEGIDRTIGQQDLSTRNDYRGLFTITIDGEDARDFDDAISLEKSAGRWVLYVHIADVSAFVCKGSPLDKDAEKRGTSFYLGQQVIPMLPELLSNELCSLREGQDRLVMTVEMTLDQKGTFQKTSFHQGIIRVNRRLTYNSVDAIMEDRNADPAIRSMLHDMFSLACALKEQRMGAGRLDLHLPEEKLIFHENRIAMIEYAPRLRSNTIIEEFMLSANSAVAKFIRQKNMPSLYRVHETMSIESYGAVKRFLGELGIKPPPGKNTGKKLQSVIDSIEGKTYAYVVNMVILKSLMQAYYGIHPLGHFGLGFKDYTHFTSPIRRYPDLVVHRCLKAIMNNTEPPYSAAELENIGEESSSMERVAQRAERDMFRIKSCRLMQHRVGEIFSGTISGVMDFGFFVTIKEMPVEGMVPMRNLTDDYYLVKEDSFTIVGRKYGRRFRLGDDIDVRLTKVELETMRIDFDIA